MELREPVAGCMYVDTFSFMRHKLVFIRKFVTSLPLLSVVVQPHKLSYALKSPSRRTGEGSCDVNDMRSACVHELDGGRYTEQSVSGWGLRGDKLLLVA